MSETKKEANKEEKQNFFAIFLLFFPTIIVAAVPSSIGGSLWTALAIKLLLAFYQFIVVKNFVDKYYGN